MNSSKQIISWWDMFEIYAQQIFIALSNLDRLAITFVASSTINKLQKQNLPLKSDVQVNITIEGLKGQIDSLISFAENLEIDATAASLKRLKISSEKGINIGDFSNAIQEITSRMHDELSSRFFVGLNSKEHDIYELSENYFGSEVSIKFPSLVYEISEAAKCRALGRSSAAVFHCIRALEGGITAISRCLSIPDPTKGYERSWEKLLGKIGMAIKEKWPDAKNRFDGDGKLFEEMHGALSGMQNPYRNSTMHLDKIYTAEDARHIYEIVSGIMRRISSRMDENGLPLA